LQEEPTGNPLGSTHAEFRTAVESLGISQEEHDRIVDECIYGKEPELVDVDDLPKEEPVSNDFEMALAEMIDKAQTSVVEPLVVAAQWKDELIKLAKSEEPVIKYLGDYINELSKQFPEVSFAKLSRIAVRVAKWQKSNLWKPADGDDLPIIDREVIALLDNGKVVFAHRPPEYWDGKNIDTDKVTRYYPKTYDKGGWNIPDVKFWLDVELPKEIEL